MLRSFGGMTAFEPLGDATSDAVAAAQAMALSKVQGVLQTRLTNLQNVLTKALAAADKNYQTRVNNIKKQYTDIFNRADPKNYGTITGKMNVALNGATKRHDADIASANHTYSVAVNTVYKQLGIPNPNVPVLSTPGLPVPAPMIATTYDPAGGAGPAPISPNVLPYSPSQFYDNSGGPAYSPSDYPAQQSYAPAPTGQYQPDYSQPSQFPIIEIPPNTWPGGDMLFAPTESIDDQVPPQDIFVPSSATIVDSNSDDVTQVSPEILDALIQSEGSMSYSDPWSGAFGAFGLQLPMPPIRSRGALQRMPRRQRRVTSVIQRLNAAPILQEFSAFEWVGPAISAAGSVASASITAALAPKAGAASSSQPIVINQPAASKASSSSSSDMLPWIIGGGAAILILGIIINKKK